VDAAVCSTGLLTVDGAGLDAAQQYLSRARWQKIRAIARARDRNTCQHADGTCTATLMVHHIVPVNEGGAPYDLANLITLCGRHHHQLEQETRQRQHMELIEKDTIIDS